jgi:uncharacterized protein (DUF1697 family)
MNTFISLLRGINVGGSKPVHMDTLAGVYIGLGFSHVRTYLQSGNVVFTAPLGDSARMASQIEAGVEAKFGFHAEVFIRQPQDFQGLLANNPFVHQAEVDPSRLHVSFLYKLPGAAAKSRLVIREGIPDKLAWGDMALYLYYPDGYARAKISTSYLEQALGVPLTNRNWNTVTALYNIAVEIDAA